MLTRYLSRPDNVLVNRLGLGTPWKVPAVFSLPTRRFFILFRLFFSRFFIYLWRSGLLHSNHPFGGRFFHDVSTLVLPLVSVSEVSKYFRLVRIRFSLRIRSSRFFIARKYLHFLNIGEFFFYRVNKLILILLFTQIPEPIKRKSFLADYLGLGNTDLRNTTIGYTRNFSVLPEFAAWSFFSKIIALL